MAAVGLLIGIPLGLVAGAFVWRRVANELGVSTGLTWPVVGVVVLVVAAVLSVNLVAASTRARAARTRPAVVLRSE